MVVFTIIKKLLMIPLAIICIPLMFLLISIGESEGIYNWFRINCIVVKCYFTDQDADEAVNRYWESKRG